MSRNSEETASRFPIPSQMRVENPEIILVNSFIVKPAGSGTTRQTLVETDSLSSFSLPEETSNRRVVADFGDDDGDGQQVVLSNGSRNRRKGQVAIDIGNSGDDQRTEPTRIETYLKFMYKICASPYNPDKRADGGGRLGKICDIVRKVLFTIFVTLSIIETLFKVKVFLLINLANGGLENFTNMASFIMNACTKVYYVYMLVQQQSKMARVHESFRQLQRFNVKKSKTTSKNGITSQKFSTRLGFCTVMVSLIQTLFAHWTPVATILHYSFRMSVNVFVWTPESTKEEMLSPLFELHAQDITTTNILLGICGGVLNYCSNTHLDVAGDLMVVTAETLKEEIGVLEAMMKGPNNGINPVTLEEFQSENGVWAHYRVLKNAVQDTNDAFDSFLKYMHVDNMMRFVYFFMNVFDGDFPIISTARMIYNILKTSYMYRCAIDASGFNESSINWVRQLVMESKEKMFVLKATFIMNELEKQPLGLGKGQFLINESFIFGFLGSVGSVRTHIVTTHNVLNVMNLRSNGYNTNDFMRSYMIVR